MTLPRLKSFLNGTSKQSVEVVLPFAKVTSRHQTPPFQFETAVAYLFLTSTSRNCPLDSGNFWQVLPMRCIRSRLCLLSVAKTVRGLFYPTPLDTCTLSRLYFEKVIQNVSSHSFVQFLKLPSGSARYKLLTRLVITLRWTRLLGAWVKC